MVVSPGPGKSHCPQECPLGRGVRALSYALGAVARQHRMGLAAAAGTHLYGDVSVSPPAPSVWATVLMEHGVLHQAELAAHWSSARRGGREVVPTAVERCAFQKRRKFRPVFFPLVAGVRVEVGYGCSGLLLGPSCCCSKLFLRLRAGGPHQEC